jgi:hypothetical protein
VSLPGPVTLLAVAAGLTWLFCRVVGRIADLRADLEELAELRAARRAPGGDR